MKSRQSNSNEKSATIFKARSCKICHILHNLHSTGFRIGTLHCTGIITRLKTWKTRSVPSGFEPATLGSKQRFVAPLANDDSGLVFQAFPAPWQSGWVVGRMHRDLAVAFIVSGLLQTTPCAPYPSKQQRPTAWITLLNPSTWNFL